MILGLTVGQVEPLVFSVLNSWEGRALCENRGLGSDEFGYPRRQNTNSGSRSFSTRSNRSSAVILTLVYCEGNK